MFPLNCDAKALGAFIDRSRPHGCGWLGFYWGQTRGELKHSSAPGDRLILEWLELFVAKTATR